jgi:hypothetical protein
MFVVVVGVAFEGGPGVKAASDDQPSAAEPVGVERLMLQADKLEPLVETEVARRFLAAVASLPRTKTRTLLRNKAERSWFTSDEAARLSETERSALSDFEADEGFYYFTAYGSPLVYVRVLELACAHGVHDLSGLKVMDFGYGSIGQLRLMASLGADVVGVDPGEALRALYSEPADQGTVAPARSVKQAASGEKSGTVTLVHPRWPATEAARNVVGGGYDLITSKNTLKNGYLHPAKPVDKRMLIDLGVSEREFVRALFDALNPGGLVIIYNLSPAPSKDDEPYKPWSDGRCPFPRKMWEDTGFDLIAFDTTDDDVARTIFRTLDYPVESSEGEPDLFSHYTIARRPR